MAWATEGFPFFGTSKNFFLVSHSFTPRGACRQGSSPITGAGSKSSAITSLSGTSQIKCNHYSAFVMSSVTIVTVCTFNVCPSTKSKNPAKMQAPSTSVFVVTVFEALRVRPCDQDKTEKRKYKTCKMLKNAAIKDKCPHLHTEKDHRLGRGSSTRSNDTYEASNSSTWN